MLEIIYHDEHLIAINKPTGLLVHRSAIDKWETQFAVQQLRDMICTKVFPVHRLDKPTAGVLLFALSSEIARELSKLFEEHNLVKTYLAVARGHTEAHGTINYPITEELDKISDKQAKKNKPPQSAITHYKRLDICELPFPVGRYQSARYSLVQLTPETGRKHQLRRHLKHISHPIVGDTTHGDGRQNQFFRENFNCSRLLLSATRLQLKHPANGKMLVLNATLDQQFLGVLNSVGMAVGCTSNRR